VDADTLLAELNAFSNYNFTSFFDRYVYGLELIPYLPYFYYDKAILALEEKNFGQAEYYFTMAHRFALKLGELDLVIECDERLGLLSGDSDGDGLSDLWETHFGTDSQNHDTDGDGLNDRSELGVIIDGKPGEYGLNQALIEDSQGDSEAPEAGTDIKQVYAQIFLNEDRNQELYLAMSTWDDEYNPDVKNHFQLWADDANYGYNFNAWWEPHLQKIIEYEIVEQHRVEGGYYQLFETTIPLDLLGDPAEIMIDAATEVWNGPGYEPHQGDRTSGALFTLPIAPHIFITDPLNPDSDGDGVSDGIEVQFGSDPTYVDSSITKSVTPQGQVNYGDELTYTLVISAVPGASVALYDPLEGINFLRFVEQPPAVTHVDTINSDTSRGFELTSIVSTKPLGRETRESTYKMIEEWPKHIK